MARDVDNQNASREGFTTVSAATGIGMSSLPVWQARPGTRASTPLTTAASLRATPPCAPTLIGARLSPSAAWCAWSVSAVMRHLYLAELVRVFPGHTLLGVGSGLSHGRQRPGTARPTGRGFDGSWWIHHARTEQFAVVQDGLLKSLRLTHTGASSFFTLPELMAANLRSLLSAYAGLWAFPAPTEVPTDLRDPDVRFELRRRLASVQLDLFAHLPVVA